MKNVYKISKIIPICVAKAKEIILEQENLNNEDFLKSCCNQFISWKDWKECAQLFQEIQLQSPKFFGNWTFLRNKVDFTISAYNNKTFERFKISYFDLYVAISEYQIHFFNFIQQNGYSNLKEIRIDYYNLFEKDEDYLLMDGEVPHGLVAGIIYYQK